ncbi:bacterio-opsin activator domain-containing protein [Halostella litorea]|uniref:bacterio-opsin activator domain-containing protein n=1 Tax=Halostella litorea TaxID=2528831 RepID=UPI001091933F|nr:bacterio-opsin activator domain-containing protein [Halostella litorea]
MSASGATADRAEWFDAAAYDRLRGATGSYREVLLVRLAAEAGLRAAEMPRVRPADLRQVREDPARHLLAVGDGDGGVARETVATPELAREIRRYARSEGVADDEPLVDVSPRRVRMIVAEATDRAAERTGDDRYADLAVGDLRRYFTRRLLVEADANPRVVKAACGWGSFEALEPYLDAPDEDALVAALSRLVGDAGGGTGELARLRYHREVATAARVAGEDALAADDRRGVERATCAGLAGGPYVGAWTTAGGIAADGGDPRAVAGVAEDAAARMATAVAATDAVDRATETGEPVVRRAADPPLSGPDGDAFRACGGASLAVVPLATRETTHGVVCVLSDRPDAFEADERAQLRALGRRVAHAVTALRRRKLLLSDAVVELAIRVDGDRSFFNRVAADCGCTLSLESLVSGDDATLVYYLSLSGASPSAAFERAEAADAVESFRLVEARADDALLEFVVSGTTPAVALTRAGATVSDVDVTGEGTRLTAELPRDADLRSVVDALADAFPSAAVIGKRETERSARTVDEFRRGVADRLTDRQESALHAAYAGGYFDWPRESTAEEIADAMGVSSPTLHNHLRKGQRELLGAVFDDGDGQQ